MTPIRCEFASDRKPRADHQYGFPRAQEEFVRALPRRGVPASRAGAWRLGLAVAQAERGDWR